MIADQQPIRTDQTLIYLNARDCVHFANALLHPRDKVKLPILAKAFDEFYSSQVAIKNTSGDFLFRLD